jgi:hypothetical protein
MSSERISGEEPGALGPEDEADALTPDEEQVIHPTGVDEELDSRLDAVNPDDPDDDPDRYVPRDGTAIYE